MKSDFVFIHCLEKTHPGSGTAVGHIDQPIQRERHTGWPSINGSELKGILRDACREKLIQDTSKYDDGLVGEGKRKRSRRQVANEDDADLIAVFGPGKVDESSAHAGALAITDARILAFPIRSARGVFFWVTCPEVLRRLSDDADASQCVDFAHEKTPTIAGNSAHYLNTSLLIDGRYAVLEDEEFVCEPAPEPIHAILKRIAGRVFAGRAARFEERLLIIGNEMFSSFVRHNTEVAARINIDYDRRTVRPGLLFYQEFLPVETLLYAIVHASEPRSRGSSLKDADAVFKYPSVKLTPEPILQIGANHTTGKGFCRVRLPRAEG